MQQIPNYPKTLPFPATNENIDKCKRWLFNQFATTVFSSCGKFSAMSGPPVPIYLKESSTPKAKHNLILILYHVKEQV